MLRKFSNLLKIKPRNEYRIEATKDGLRCASSREGTQIITWDSILEIEGFKRDEVTTDLICLIIKYYNGAKKMIEINEEMKGFGDAVRELERQEFLKSDWRKFVTLPPFQAQKVVLFTTSKLY